jgi:hypothetical protein
MRCRDRHTRRYSGSGHIEAQASISYGAPTNHRLLENQQLKHQHLQHRLEKRSTGENIIWQKHRFTADILLLCSASNFDFDCYLNAT